MKLSKKDDRLVRESIVHWVVDIWQELKRGRRIEGKPIPASWTGDLFWADTGRLAPCFAHNCPLCQAYDDCINCPLFRPERNCGDDGHPWAKFIDDPTADNALNMIKALQSLL